MGRLADHHLALPDGRRIGYSLTSRPHGFRVRFVDPLGRRVERATGCRRKTDARHAAEAVVRAAYAAPESPPDTWAAAVRHLEAVPDLRPKSVKAYRLAARAVRDTYPDLAGPAAVTPELARRFPALWAAVPVRAGTPRSPQTVNSALTHLRSLWKKHWMPAGFVAANPWPAVSLLNAPRGRRVRVPAEESVGEFFAYLRARYPDWELPRVFVLVKLLAGCRTLDLCRARTEHLTAAGLKLERGTTKDRKDRLLVLPADVLADVRRLAGPTWVWERAAAELPRHRRQMTDRHAAGFRPQSWAETVANLFREFNDGWPGKTPRPPERRVRPHDLRARAMTTAAKMLGSADAVARLIGCDPATARHYIEASAYDARAAGVVDALRPPVPEKE